VSRATACERARKFVHSGKVARSTTTAGARSAAKAKAKPRASHASGAAKSPTAKSPTAKASVAKTATGPADAESPATNERINLPVPDYEADDVLVVRESEQLRALGDDLRSTIVILLREHAHSTTELAEKLGMAKGTVGHHVKVLEKAGLVRVVRTRKVRAVTESYYGRTARLFLFKSTDADGEDVRNVAAASLRRAAEEILPFGSDDWTTFSVLRVRLTDADAKRFMRRLEKLAEDFRTADTADGDPFGLAAALFRRAPDA
jgi:DNA-binding transcriptional ArsR family regulator